MFLATRAGGDHCIMPPCAETATSLDKAAPSGRSGKRVPTITRAPEPLDEVVVDQSARCFPPDHRHDGRASSSSSSATTANCSRGSTLGSERSRRRRDGAQQSCHHELRGHRFRRCVSNFIPGSSSSGA